MNTLTLLPLCVAPVVQLVKADDGIGGVYLLPLVRRDRPIAHDCYRAQRVRNAPQRLHHTQPQLMTAASLPLLYFSTPHRLHVPQELGTN